MDFLTESLGLEVTGIILTGETNDVLLCKKHTELYILWVLKDRALIRYFMEPDHALPWISCFPYGELLYIQMPYKERRSLFRFWQPKAADEEKIELLFRDMLVLCMTARLPPPVLLLMIEQRMFHIKRDGSLYFIYELNLEALDVQAGERDCAKALAELSLELINKGEKRGERLYQLIEKKLDRNRYQTCLDLYLDFRHSKAESHKWSPSDKFKIRLFYILTVLAAAAILFLLIVIVSQVIFGEVPFLRLFAENAHKIGTEVLGK